MIERMPDSTADHLRRRAIQLEWATNVWNAMEVVVTITLGVLAGSLALVAFGLDSLIEVFASTVVIVHPGDRAPDPGDRRTHRSLRLIALAFFVLSAYLIVASVRSFIAAEQPATSPLGIAYMALTTCAMFALATWKQRIARASGSEPLDREAEVTYVDSALSLGILIALSVNSLFGWWWADALAALGVGLYSAFAGIGTWRQGAPHQPLPE
jgi:divalent metal cation (Fe/Co/Zn/Cd) transporter